MIIPPEDLKIELIYMQTGTNESPGGQQAGSPATAVRATHIPTLTMAQCGLFQSQHKNKKVAMEMLEWALSV